jgi:prepilin-type N-terminal cleavage/methylation domain-containing protein
MKDRKKIKKSGFTLVETLVAISVLSLSILGAFTAVQSGLQKSIYVKDQISAFYLVQEAMEYIHNIRDKNALVAMSSGGSPDDWLVGLANSASDPCYYGDGRVCKIDSPAGSISTCGATGSCPFLKQDANYLFGYTSGTDTRFKREIQFERINLVDIKKEIMVTITVSWGSNTFQVKQLFMNNRFSI